jgi:recombination protein RecA
LKNSAALHLQIENSLAARIPSALTPRLRTEAERIASGVPAWDELLQGGLPVGALTEFVGTECSGRTTMALAYMAAVTHGGSVCAWIDVANALDPEAVAANGVDMERLLWVKCGVAAKALTTAVVENAPLPMVSPASQARHTGGGSPHPRSEGKDMPQAIGALLQAHGGLYDKQVRRERKSVGTPEAMNRSLSYRSDDREEQVNSDRLPARRGDQVVAAHLAPRCAELQPRRVASLPRREASLPKVEARRGTAHSTNNPWSALDQALRATDLLLQGGGFSAIVLDLGSTPAEFAWRIPLATWFRFRAACERTRVSLLLLTQHPCARSSAELVVRMEAGSMEAEGKVMTGIRYHAEVERHRFQQREANVVPIRKPPQSERPGQWRGDTAWAQGQ